MEPISTLLVAAMFCSPAAATRRVIWGGEPHSVRVTRSTGNNTLTALMPDAAISQTDCILYKPGTVPVLSAKEQLKRETSAYLAMKDGWDGSDSVGPSLESMAIAIHLIDAIPSRLSLPRPMLFRNGELGLFWDSQGGYAELNVEVDGGISFFARQHSGEEHFDDRIAIASMDQNWFWGAIGHLDKPLQLAA